MGKGAITCRIDIPPPDQHKPLDDFQPAVGRTGFRGGQQHRHAAGAHHGLHIPGRDVETIAVGDPVGG